MSECTYSWEYYLKSSHLGRSQVYYVIIPKVTPLITEKPWRCNVQYRKWRSQRTYTHDPWT